MKRIFFGVITALALEKCKKNAIFFKLFWYKVFVPWKLKILNFLVDSVLIVLTPQPPPTPHFYCFHATTTTTNVTF